MLESLLASVGSLDAVLKIAKTVVPNGYNLMCCVEELTTANHNISAVVARSVDALKEISSKGDISKEEMANISKMVEHALINCANVLNRLKD